MDETCIVLNASIVFEVEVCASVAVCLGFLVYAKYILPRGDLPRVCNSKLLETWGTACDVLHASTCAIYI